MATPCPLLPPAPSTRDTGCLQGGLARPGGRPGDTGAQSGRRTPQGRFTCTPAGSWLARRPVATASVISNMSPQLPLCPLQGFLHTGLTAISPEAAPRGCPSPVGSARGHKVLTVGARRHRRARTCALCSHARAAPRGTRAAAQRLSVTRDVAGPPGGHPHAASGDTPPYPSPGHPARSVPHSPSRPSGTGPAETSPEGPGPALPSALCTDVGSVGGARLRTCRRRVYDTEGGMEAHRQDQSQPALRPAPASFTLRGASR